MVLLLTIRKSTTGKRRGRVLLEQSDEEEEKSNRGRHTTQRANWIVLHLFTHLTNPLCQGKNTCTKSSEENGQNSMP